MDLLDGDLLPGDPDPRSRAADDELDEVGGPGDSEDEPPRTGSRRRGQRVLVGVAVLAVLVAAVAMYSLGRRDGHDVALAAERSRVSLLVGPGVGGGVMVGSNGPANGRMVAPLSLTVTNGGAPVTITGFESPLPGLEFLPLDSTLHLGRGESQQVVVHVAMPCRSEDRATDAPANITILGTDDAGGRHRVTADLHGLLDYTLHSVGDCDAENVMAVPVVTGWTRTSGGIRLRLDLHNLVQRDVTMRLTGSEVEIRSANLRNEFRVPAGKTTSASVQLTMPNCQSSLATVLSSLNFETGLVTRAGTYSPQWGGQLDLPNDAVVALLATCGSPAVSSSSTNGAAAR